MTGASHRSHQAVTGVPPRSYWRARPELSAAISTRVQHRSRPAAASTGTCGTTTCPNDRQRPAPQVCMRGQRTGARRAARTSLERDLASYTSPGDLNDLDAILDRHSEEDTADIRRILAAPRCLTAPQPSVRCWPETGIDQACCTGASSSSDCSGARTGPLASQPRKQLPSASPAQGRRAAAGPGPRPREDQLPASAMRCCRRAGAGWHFQPPGQPAPPGRGARCRACLPGLPGDRCTASERCLPGRHEFLRCRGADGAGRGNPGRRRRRVRVDEPGATGGRARAGAGSRFRRTGRS
jgi:hypothetical protein